MTVTWWDSLVKLLLIVSIILIGIWFVELFWGFKYIPKKYFDSVIQLIAAIILIAPSTLLQKVPWWLRVTLSIGLILGNVAKLIIGPLLR